MTEAATPVPTSVPIPTPTPDPIAVARRAEEVAVAEAKQRRLDAERQKAEEEQRRSDAVKGRLLFGLIVSSLVALIIYGTRQQKKKEELALAGAKSAAWHAQKAAQEASDLAAEAKAILAAANEDTEVTLLQIQNVQAQILQKVQSTNKELERAYEQFRIAPDIVSGEFEKTKSACLMAQEAEKQINETIKQASWGARVEYIKNAPQEVAQFATDRY